MPFNPQHQHDWSSTFLQRISSFLSELLETISLNSEHVSTNGLNGFHGCTTMRKMMWSYALYAIRFITRVSREFSILVLIYCFNEQKDFTDLKLRICYKVFIGHWQNVEWNNCSYCKQHDRMTDYFIFRVESVWESKRRYLH